MVKPHPLINFITEIVAKVDKTTNIFCFLIRHIKARQDITIWLGGLGLKLKGNDSYERLQKIDISFLSQQSKSYGMVDC